MVVVNWDEMHRNGLRPWDLNDVTPMLKFFFESDEIGKEMTQSSEIKRILIPGCGQKHDSEYLGSIFGNSRIIGADISATAAKNCREQLAGGVENVEFVEADFFAAADLGDFDLIFDHTFFCAIDPSKRSDWAAKMGELLSVKKGRLLTIIYPLPGEDLMSKEGPPFEVTFAAYQEVLTEFGFECLKRWGNSELPASNPKRLGREELALWQKN